MTFDKEIYWSTKADNIGSKRPKPEFHEIPGKHVKQHNNKIILLNRKQDRMKLPDERNTKSHRDHRTADHAKFVDYQLSMETK